MIRLDLTNEQFKELLLTVDRQPTAEKMERLNAVMYEIVMSKIQRMVEHDLYTTYKTAATEEEKEKARQRYLDEKGIPASFRW